eukprot:TRINITY_DN5465_c0_g1_i4.p1 TRINITY_DN5465_c0_g1~~TRINITY_DN5465_c0_g1_i4.p1  ORF type:complete len:140 (+),score=12.79 TRINITY_DN5465_c0_g1_i4:81-500(+)
MKSRKTSNMCSYLRCALAALRISDVADCVVECGPVCGSALVQQCTGSRLAIAARQIRIHDSERTDVLVCAASAPIIERCRGLRFGPYRLEYQGIQNDLSTAGLTADYAAPAHWRSVRDFGWLRPGPSPNWTEIPPDSAT